MAHLEDDQIYSLFYYLRQHYDSKKPIEGLKLWPDLEKLVKRVNPKNFKIEPAKEHRIKEDAVIKLVKHIEKCPDCQQAAFEDGPHSTRLLSAEEKIAAEQAKQAEIERLSKRFVGYAIAAIVFLFAMLLCQKWHIQWILDMREKNQTAAASVSNNQGPPFPPYRVAQLVCILITSWCAASCWGLARHLWMDLDKVKQSVPFIGKKWAARSRSKEQELELKRLQLDNYDEQDEDA